MLPDLQGKKKTPKKRKREPSDAHEESMQISYQAEESTNSAMMIDGEDNTTKPTPSENTESQPQPTTPAKKAKKSDTVCHVRSSILLAMLLNIFSHPQLLLQTPRSY